MSTGKRGRERDREKTGEREVKEEESRKRGLERLIGDSQIPLPVPPDSPNLPHPQKPPGDGGCTPGLNFVPGGLEGKTMPRRSGDGEGELEGQV